MMLCQFVIPFGEICKFSELVRVVVDLSKAHKKMQMKEVSSRVTTLCASASISFN